jgi:transcriptional regulator with XRE-family HTH domain
LNSYFPRIITLLRKERGLSQKSVAANLGVSQALLSHYEKGIRECGLDFVVKIADFYHVSCDYLLGRTPHPAGFAAAQQQQHGTQEMRQPAQQEPLEQALLLNSISVLYEILQNCRSKDLSAEVSAYLFAAVYRVFRILYSSNSKNPQGMFAVKEKLADGRAAACSEVALSNIRCLLAGEDVEELKGILRMDLPSLSPEKLSVLCPALCSSLFTLIQRVETRMGVPMAGEGSVKRPV